MEFAERAARNEEIFRGVNERIEQGAQRHQLTTAIPFHCECGQASCFEYVELAPAHYDRVAAERYRFVVVPATSSRRSSWSSSDTRPSSSSRRSVTRASRSTATIRRRGTARSGVRSNLATRRNQ